MWIELKELESEEVNAFNTEDFKRIQKVRRSNNELVCITFKDGGEILFDEKYSDVMKKLK